MIDTETVITDIEKKIATGELPFAEDLSQQQKLEKTLPEHPDAAENKKRREIMTHFSSMFHEFMNFYHAGKKEDALRILEEIREEEKKLDIDLNNYFAAIEKTEKLLNK